MQPLEYGRTWLRGQSTQGVSDPQHGRVPWRRRRVVFVPFRKQLTLLKAIGKSPKRALQRRRGRPTTHSAMWHASAILAAEPRAGERHCRECRDDSYKAATSGSRRPLARPQRPRGRSLPLGPDLLRRCQARVVSQGDAPPTAVPSEPQRHTTQTSSRIVKVVALHGSESDAGCFLHRRGLSGPDPHIAAMFCKLPTVVVGNVGRSGFAG